MNKNRRFLLITTGVLIAAGAIAIAVAIVAMTSHPGNATGPDMLTAGQESGSLTINNTPAATITIAVPVLTTQPADTAIGDPPEYGYFLITDVTIRALPGYTGGVFVSSADFYVLANSQHYDEGNGTSFDAMADPGLDLASTTLAAGESTHGKLTFDVPSRHGEIVFAPNENHQPVAEWSY